MNTENIVKLNQLDIFHLAEGKLIYVDHPTKGMRKVDAKNVYVNTFGMVLTEEELATIKN